MTKQEAGRLGGQTTFKRHGRAHMSEIGRKGYEATAAKYKLVPIGTSKWGFVDRQTNKIVVTF